MGKYTREMFVADNLDLNNNLREWDLLTTASIFKNEYKDTEAEKEIILSYANALNCIANSLMSQNHSEKIMMTLRTNSLTIPFMFLARHTVELTLKFLCSKLRIEYKPIHNLSYLWNQILEYLSKYVCFNDYDFEDINIFIKSIEEIDIDGSRSRYSKDNQGKMYNENPKFINTQNINYFIQNLFIPLVNMKEQDFNNTSY